MTIEDDRLDNPVWHSLNETHKEFAIDFSNIKFYQPDYCPFGAAAMAENSVDDIDEYLKLCDNFYMVGERPVYSQAAKLNRELVCLQMVMDRQPNVAWKDEIVELNSSHSSQLFSLVNLVQPGYFKSKTAQLGDYFGIFKNEELLAVTGERMKMTGWTEISAVVTHPDHTGLGYAKQLISHVANHILRSGALPYLHVAESNAKAIGLYSTLGFRRLRKISFWHLIRR